MARPRKQIDAELVRKLASIGCTMLEIAAVCECSEDTLERRFADVIKNGQQLGRSSLRRHQWKLAEAGNATMLIWLGKQWLGQRDKTDTELSGPNGGALQVMNEIVIRGVNATVTADRSASEGE